MRGEHVWLSDEYSVPRERLCMHRPPSPNADHGCVRAKDHPGKHEYMMLTEPGVIRAYSAQEARAKAIEAGLSALRGEDERDVG